MTARTATCGGGAARSRRAYMAVSLASCAGKECVAAQATAAAAQLPLEAATHARINEVAHEAAAVKLAAAEFRAVHTAGAAEVGGSTPGMRTCRVSRS
jgi:hypothetical protein